MGPEYLPAGTQLQQLGFDNPRASRTAVLLKKTDSAAFESGFFKQRLFQGCIRDVARRGWILLRLGNPLECGAVAVEAQASAPACLYKRLRRNAR